MPVDNIAINIKAAYDGGRAITRADDDLEGLARTTVSANKELRALQKTSGDIKGFKRLEQEAAASGLALAEAGRKVDSLKTAMDRAGTGAGRMAKEYKAAQADVTRLTKTHDRHNQALDKQSQRLKKAGVDTANLAAHEKRLAGELAKATRNVEAQSRALKKQKDLAAEVANTSNRMARALSQAANISFVAGAASAVGRTLLGPLNQVIEATRRQEAAEKQLEVAIKSTGGAAGLSADQLKAMAAEMQGLTTFGDEAVMEMQSLLLTFTEIKGPVFKQATQAILDMATRLGTDLKGASIQVGKALNDPIKGVSALAKAGIQFTASQKGMIDALVKTGDTAAAQGIILKELEVQFGGSAAAAANTFGGALDQLGNTFGDLFEAKGGLSSATEALQRLTTSLADPRVTGAINTLSSQLIGLVGDAAAAAQEFTAWAGENGELIATIGGITVKMGALATVLGPVLLGFAALRGSVGLLLGGLRHIGTGLAAANLALAGAATNTKALAGATELAGARIRVLSGLVRATPWALFAAGAIGAASAVADYVEETSRAEQNAQVLAASTAAWIAQIDRIDATLPKLEQYANITRRSAEQVAALGDTERQRYAAGLTGLAEYLTALRGRAALEQSMVGEQIKAAEVAGASAQALTALRERYTEISATLTGVNERLATARLAQADLATSATAAAQQVSAAALAMVTGFEALRVKGVETGKALTDIGAALDLSDMTTIGTWVEGMRLLQEQGQITDAELRAGVSATLQKLSAEDLQAFQIQAVAAFGETAESAEQLALVLDGTLSASLKLLGIEADDSGQQAAIAFATLADNATASATQIEQGLTATLRKINSETDLETVRLALEGLGSQGEISGRRMTAALAAVEQKTRELAATLTGELADAFARMGIKSRDELTAIAKQAEQDLGLIRDSGLATSAELAKAAGQYLDAERAAHDGVLPMVLEVTRAKEDLARAAVAAGDAGEDAGRRIADGMREASTEASRAAGAIQTTADASRDLERGAVSGSAGSGYRDQVAAGGDAQALADFDRQVSHIADLPRSLERTLDIYQSITDDVLRAAARRAAATGQTATQTATATAATGRTAFITFRDRGATGQVTVIGDTDQFLASIERAATTVSG